jgi:hypothetical protein
MKFTGDADGIAALKRIKEERVEYLKYLLKEAQTNFGFTTTFKDQNVKYKITFSPQTQTLDVQKEPAPAG